MLRSGANGPLLEKYPAAPARKPLWSQTLTRGTGDQQWTPLVVSRDGGIVLTASSKGVERFDGMTGAPLGVLGSCDANKNESPIIAVSPDGSTLAIGKQSVCLLPAESANIEADTPRLGSLSSPVTGLAFDPRGARLWVQTAKELAAWDVATRERVVTLNLQNIWQFALSSDGKYVVTSRDWTGGIELWNAETGAPAGRVAPPRLGNETPSRPLTFMADDRRVVALSTGGGYYILDPVAGVASPERDPDTVYRTLASSADGRWVAFARVGGLDPSPSFTFVPTEQLRLQP